MRGKLLHTVDRRSLPLDKTRIRSTNIKFMRDPGDYFPGKEEILLERTLAYFRQHNRKGAMKIVKVYTQVAELYKGEVREDGITPAVCHFLWVANELAKRGHRRNTIIAALLHDAVEDGKLSLEEVRKGFGKEVATLVDLVTKPKLILIGDKEEGETERNVIVTIDGNIVEGKWIFASDPRYSELENQYARVEKQGAWIENTREDVYTTRAQVYFSRLKKSGRLDALAVKLFDTINNFMEIDNLKPGRRERNRAIMVAHILRIAPRLLSQKDTGLLLVELDRKGVKLPEDAFPKPPAGKVVVLPPRREVARELETLPSNTAGYISVYKPNSQGKIELGFPVGFSIPPLEVLGRLFGKGTTVKMGKSLVSPGMGPFEIIVSIGNASLETVKKVAMALTLSL